MTKVRHCSYCRRDTIHDTIRERPIAREMEESTGRLGIGLITFGLSEVLNAVVWKTRWECQRCNKRTDKN